MLRNESPTRQLSFVTVVFLCITSYDSSNFCILLYVSKNVLTIRKGQKKATGELINNKILEHALYKERYFYFHDVYKAIFSGFVAN